MTKLALWLYWKLRAFLNRRGAFPPSTPCLLCSVGSGSEEPDDDGEDLPEAILEVLRAYSVPRLTPVSQGEINCAPKAMPVGDVRFAVWSRGFVDTRTDDPGEAKKAWRRVTQRAGIHQFWDSEHSIERPRTEKIIPLAAGDV